MLPEELAIVGRFSDLDRADRAKALLEAQGIEVWIVFEQQTRRHWHVKVAVSSEICVRAQEILDVD